MKAMAFAVPKWTLLFLLAPLAGCGAPLETDLADADLTGQGLEIGPSASLEIPSIGTGWSTPGEKYMGRCVVAQVKHLPAGDAASTLKITSMLDSEKAQQQLGFQLGAKAHFGIASASLQAQAASAMTRDAFSSVWVFAANYISEADEFDVDSDIRLSLVGRAAERQNAWQHECGDEFVYQVLKGAQLFVVYRLDFNSEDVKEHVDVQMAGSKSVAEINGKLRQEGSQLAQHAKLSVEVYQFGGDPTRITGIVTGPEANADEAQAAAKAVIKCDVDNLEACETFLTNALLYATSLTAPEAFPQQIKAHANPVAYVTAPWSHLGQRVSKAPMVEAIQDARLNLAMAFDKTLAAKKRVDLLLSSDWIDTAQRDELLPWSTKLNYAFSRIVGTVSICYDDLQVEEKRGITGYSEASQNRCTDTVAKLTAGLPYPPAALLRGAAERAISQKWETALRGIGTDPLHHTQRVGDVVCGFTGDNAICGYQGPRGAVAYVLDAAIFDAWAKLPESIRLQRALVPTADMRTQGGVRSVEFAPHSAFFLPPQSSALAQAQDNCEYQEAVLLSDNVLDCWRTGGGVETFGWPLHNQFDLPDNGGAFGLFSSHNAIFSAAAYSCVEMPETVLSHWLRVGGPQSCLGYPTSKNDNDGVTRYSCFSGGYVMSDEQNRVEPVSRCPWLTSSHCR